MFHNQASGRDWKVAGLPFQAQNQFQAIHLTHRQGIVVYFGRLLDFNGRRILRV